MPLGCWAALMLPDTVGHQPQGACGPTWGQLARLLGVLWVLVYMGLVEVTSSGCMQANLATWTEDQLAMSLGLPAPPPAPAAGWGLPFGRRVRTRRGDELPEADWVVRHALPVRSAYTQVRGAGVRPCSSSIVLSSTIDEKTRLAAGVKTGHCSSHGVSSMPRWAWGKAQPSQYC